MRTEDGRTDMTKIIVAFLKRRKENQLDATEGFYCTYNLLNMFREFVCPPPGARDYTCVITGYSV